MRPWPAPSVTRLFERPLVPVERQRAVATRAQASAARERLEEAP